MGRLLRSLRGIPPPLPSKNTALVSSANVLTTPLKKLWTPQGEILVSSTRKSRQQLRFLATKEAEKATKIMAPSLNRRERRAVARAIGAQLAAEV